MSEQTQDQTTVLQDIVISDSVAVVTGGASGIGKGIVGALLRHGAKVVIADIEQSAIDETVAEMSAHGKVNLLYNNAGVTSGGGGKPWQQEPNDWRWCFGVNVFGTAICTSEFVPRMIEGGHPGQVINTSSGDGGFAPVPTASVYAASKAAVSCFTEALHHNLESEGTQLRASVFYPAGGLQRTGLFTAQRNRPEHLQRVGEGTGRKSMTFDEMKALLERSGRDVKEADLDAQGDMVVNNTVARTYIITNDLRDTVDLLHRRADAIGRLEVPPHHGMPKMT